METIVPLCLGSQKVSFFETQESISEGASLAEMGWSFPGHHGDVQLHNRDSHSLLERATSSLSPAKHRTSMTSALGRPIHLQQKMLEGTSQEPLPEVMN